MGTARAKREERMLVRDEWRGHRMPSKPKRCIYRRGNSTLHIRHKAGASDITKDGGTGGAQDGYVYSGVRAWGVPGDAVFRDSLSGFTLGGVPGFRRERTSRHCSKLTGSERKRYEMLRDFGPLNRKACGVEDEYAHLHARAGASKG